MPLPPALVSLMAKKRRGLTGPELFRKLVEQDRLLASKGFPPISAWWLEKLEAFYASGKRRFVGRVGRRGGKSSTLCRVAIVEALYGDFHVPPGDIGVFAIISVSRPEAAKRLVTIKAILDAIGVKYGPVGDGIPGVKVDGRPIAFQTFAATIAGVSGFTCIGALCDEMAKWRDNDTGANPATDVLRSLTPTLATMPAAHELWVSSPWSTLDAHHDAFAEGDTDEQMVAHAPTWVANPSVSEEYTHTLEPDEQSHAREYGAVPMGSTEVNFFDHRMIEAAINPALVLPLPPVPRIIITAGGDLGFVRDSAALAVVHREGDWRVDDSRYRVAELLEVQPKPEAPLMPGDVMAKFAERIRWHRCGWMMGDGHYKMTAVEHLQKAGLKFREAPDGQQGKAETYVRARVLLNGKRIELPQHQRLIAQLKEVLSKPTPGGGLTIWTPKKGGGHGDLVSSLVLAMWQKTGREQKADTPEPGTPEALELEEARMIAQVRKAAQDRRLPIWERKQR